MLKIFAIVLFTSLNVFAGNQLPKQALIQLNLNEPSTRISLPQLDFAKIKSKNCSVSVCIVEFNQAATITVGSETYDLDKYGEFFMKKDGLALENIRAIKYRLYSPLMEAIVNRLYINLESGEVRIVGTNHVGKVVDWY